MMREGGNLRLAVLIGSICSLVLAVYYFHVLKQGNLISADSVKDGLENIRAKGNGEFFSCLPIRHVHIRTHVYMCTTAPSPQKDRGEKRSPIFLGGEGGCTQLRIESKNAV